MLTLTSCVPRSDWTESVWIPTDLVKFLVHSVCLLRKKLRHLAACWCYYFPIKSFGGELVQWGGEGGTIPTCDPSACDPPMYVRVCLCRRLWVRGCSCFCMCQFHFAWLSMSSNALLCYWFLCEYLCIPCFCVIKWQSALSCQMDTIYSMCVGVCTKTCEHLCVKLLTRPS